MAREYDEQQEEQTAVNRLITFIAVGMIVIVITITVVGICYAQYRSGLLEGSFDFASTTTRLKAFYPEDGTEWQNGDESISFTFGNDGDFMRYCFYQYPNACHEDANIETADDVIELFRTDYDAWGYLKDVRYRYSEDVYVTWLNDGVHGWHCYIIDPDSPSAWNSAEYELKLGWLYKDGVRLMTCDDKSRVSTMMPHELVTKYQIGEWSGETLRSADASTLVYIEGISGRLVYMYSAEYYDEDVDPQGIAYQDYEAPWWESISADEARDVLQTAEDVMEGDKIISGKRTVDCYPDLPIGYRPVIYDTERYHAREHADVAQEAREGTFFLVDDGAIMSSRGEIVERWKFNVTPPDDDAGYCILDQISIYEESGYYAVAYVNNQLIGLKKGGKIETIFDKVVSKSPNRYMMSGVMGLKGDEMLHWDRRETTLVAEGVVDAKFGHMSIFETAEGCYVLTPKIKYDTITGGYEITYLGDASLQYYLWVYETLDNSSFHD